MKNVINFFGLILFIAFLVSFVLFYPEEKDYLQR